MSYNLPRSQLLAWSPTEITVLTSKEFDVLQGQGETPIKSACGAASSNVLCFIAFWGQIFTAEISASMRLRMSHEDLICMVRGRGTVFQTVAQGWLCVVGGGPVVMLLLGNSNPVTRKL